MCSTTAAAITEGTPADLALVELGEFWVTFGPGYLAEFIPSLLRAPRY